MQKTLLSALRNAVLIVSLIMMPLPSSAAAYKGYDGTVSEKAIQLTMKPSEVKTVILTYTNTGTKTWARGSGAGKVALFLVDAQPSSFKDKTWIDGETPARIKDASVASGKKTTVSFTIKAPKNVGTYAQTFRLAADDVAWMRGAETKITVLVKDAAAATTPTPVTPSESVDTTTTVPYTGMLMLRSKKDLSLAGGEKATVTYGFKNTGSSVWKVKSLRLSGLHSALVDASSKSVADSSWSSPTEPVVEASTEVKPGEIGFLSFAIKAPVQRGSYTAKFSLFADGQQVTGATVDIPITVTADGVFDTAPITPPSTATVNGIQQSPSFQTTEPILRVGIFATTDDRMMIRGVNGGYRVHQKGTTVCTFLQNQVVTISYDRTNGVYRVSGPDCTSQSSSTYQVQSTVGDWEPLEMTDFSRPVSWLPGANDNTFRGILELRYASEDDEPAVWVINELPIEMYLRGIAETSDVSPIEYQKALLTAARTYAYYHWTRGTKHAERGFHVDAKYDQVYRGYGAEARSPKIVQAVTETRGQIVTYQGKLAITPYFSRSDGRTRSWGEVWAGGSNYPWLVTVPVPQDNGKTLWGHGVGLSASGALAMANEGTDYLGILKHFYTGIESLLFY
ncbi:MAG: hypothetical protein KIH65_005130 [Candidatus Uhrbacteria bacterium]|nr:hypothetical protein [Candidatus Uhrbacteria bacterium]